MPKISFLKHLIQSDPLPVILMSDISKQVINSSWEQVHNVVENVITELCGNFNSLHTGWADILLPRGHSGPSSLNHLLIFHPYICDALNMNFLISVLQDQVNIISSAHTFPSLCRALSHNKLHKGQCSHVRSRKAGGHFSKSWFHVSASSLSM